MTLTEAIQSWGYSPIPGEAEDCGTVEVFGASGDRFTITYSLIEGSGVVEVIDRSTNPHEEVAIFSGIGVLAIRRGIQSAFALIGAAS